MKIAVNVRLLLPNKLEGIGWFTYESLKRITQKHPEHEFIFIFDRPYSEEFIFSKNVTPVVAHPPARHPFLWYLFFEFGVMKVLRKYKPDILVSPDGWIPLRAKIPVLNVIHDLNFAHHPEFIKPLMRKYYNTFFPRFARKASRLATVSEYTKKDLVDTYGIDPEKIDVTYNGSNDLYKPISEELKQQTRDKLTNGCPYFVFISAIHQRKNVANLFRAFDLFKTQTGLDTKLVIVGSKKWWAGEIEDTYLKMRWKEEVIFTGRLAPDVLNNVLASSVALTYVSFFEGFGIPIVEAFNAETAVITANTTSMPEIAGDAALFADPYSVESIAGAMQKIIGNEELRNSLIEKGRIRRNDFSWDKTADLLWKAIEKI